MLQATRRATAIAADAGVLYPALMVLDTIDGFLADLGWQVNANHDVEIMMELSHCSAVCLPFAFSQGATQPGLAELASRPRPIPQATAVVLACLQTAAGCATTLPLR
jgi:hypothetical protein